MQINNHLTPAHFGHGGRPDHAGHGAGKGAQSPTVAAEIEPATVTDTTTAVAPVEETEGAEKHKNSVAHEARRHLANLAESKALGGHNFGWLVSQIARGLFNPADYAPASEDGEDTGVIVDETAGDPTTEIDTAIDEAPV
ncbi:MAG: hypothetical protein OER92_08935, partial [Alphaproteobacteria bacterium]|nr:hypothetical protein [Alphaproteobacteria bacterium]